MSKATDAAIKEFKQRKVDLPEDETGDATILVEDLIEHLEAAYEFQSEVKKLISDLADLADDTP